MLFSLFITFLKIGLFTFGGGYAMIANIREVVVEKKKWLTEDELLSVIAIAESTPGPIAINLATYVGYKKKGVPGSACATAGVVIPSLVIIYIISLFFDAFLQNKYVGYAFVGIKSAVAFLIIKAGVDMLKKLEKKLFLRVTFAAVFIILAVLELLCIDFGSIYLIMIGGAVGIAAYSLPCKREGKK